MNLEQIVKTVMGILAMLTPQFKKADSKVGVKESKEMLIGLNEVTLFLAEKLKDGAQFSDATDFYSKLTTDEEFKKVVSDAYDKKELIPEEMKDVDAGEALELVAVQVEYAPKLVDAFKK